MVTLDMSQFEGDENKPVGAESGPKSVLAQRLREAGVGVERFIDVHPGTKTPAQKWRDDGLGRHPDEVGENCAIKCGNGLIVLDIDDPEDAPEGLPETFTVESPHGSDERGHLYYRVGETIGSPKAEFGEVQGEGSIVIGPGSVLDHGECKDGKENCPGEGVGTYRLDNKPIATLSGDHLEQLREIRDSGGDGTTQRDEYGGDRISLPDEAVADEGERYICTGFTRRRDTGDLAGQEIMDFLRGGTGSYELQRDDGTGIDQSTADYYTLDMLYGAFKFRGEDEKDARRFSLAVFKRYCRENTYDKSGNLRKSLRKGEAYLQEQMDTVQRKFDLDKWNRWRRRDHADGFDAEEHKPWADPAKDGVPSLITQDTIKASLHILTSDLDPEYIARQYGLDISSITPTTCGEMFTPLDGSTSPDSRRYLTSSEIGKFAHEINPERKASYFEEVVKILSRETDDVAHAYCPYRPNGERHVYYLAEQPNPEDARWVKVNSEKQDLEPPEDDAKQELMTDGGVDVGQSESRDKLDRIRKAREDSEGSDNPDLYPCPVEDCSKVLMEEGALRNHVSQSDDEPHRGLTLDDELTSIEKYKLEDVLREQYVKQGKTLKELEEEWGTHRGTIHYWMSQHGVERRRHVATPVRRASFGLDSSGYERMQSRIPGTRKNDAIQLHQLVVIAEGADPEMVFSGGDYHCHHRNGIPWDNRPGNVELLSREAHQRAHQRDEWTEEDGFPVLVTGQPLSEEEYHSTWGPGVPNTDSEQQDEGGDLWAPGPLNQTV